MTVTIDTILDFLTKNVEEKIPVDPHTWIDAAQKMALLSGSETEKLYLLHQEVSKEKVAHIESGKSVAESKIRVEASDIFREMMQQKARVDRIQEMIRISKIQARLSSEEMRGLA